MPGAKYTQTYQKVSAMGEKLKAAGKPGPSNDEQLKVRPSFLLFRLSFSSLVYYSTAVQMLTLVQL
jgi:hypothetical protein